MQAAEELGILQSTISKWELGKQTPRFNEDLQAVADYLGESFEAVAALARGVAPGPETISERLARVEEMVEEQAATVAALRREIRSLLRQRRGVSNGG